MSCTYCRTKKNLYLVYKKGHCDIDFKFVICESCWKNVGSSYNHYGMPFVKKKYMILMKIA